MDDGVIELAPPAPPAQALARIAAATGRALLVDLAAGAVVAATPAAALSLAIEPGHASASFDAAMPALAELRRRARAADASNGTEAVLDLWAPRGIARLKARLTYYPAEGRPSIVLIEEVTDQSSREPPRATTAAAETPLAAFEAAPPQALSAPLSDTAPLIAHEIRTPLSAIAAAAEIMSDAHFGPLGDERYAAYARHIQDAARFALAVVDRMMRDALEPALEAADPTEIDVEALATAVIGELRPLAEKRGLALALAVLAKPDHTAAKSKRQKRPAAHPLPRLIADATSLRQILINLLGNAMKNTRAGGRIALEIAEDGDGGLSFTIADSGCGMSQADIARALEGAAKAPDRAEARARPGGGLGFGLPLVRALAAAIGATFSLESAEGSGTRARITFSSNRLKAP